MVLTCDNDSEFDFRWNGPSSILDWACKGVVIVIFSCVTFFEIIFCGRWRDFWPFNKTELGVDLRVREEIDIDNVDKTKAGEK
jgi:hypothetical protein